MRSVVIGGPKKPTNPETDAYRKYLENQKNRGGYGNAKDRTPEEKKWDQWKKDNTPDGLSDYQEYRDNRGGVRKEDETTRAEGQKWSDFETEHFGGSLEQGKGTGEGGKYTVDDLYIKASDKRWEDQRRSDLLIDPDKKGGGGGKKGGGRKTGGKTGGPGNPNTGGGGAGDANL
tara:strand:+ start:605 stop:1126 length:522 start_codon:yes stop_codon:yes gene_type:complete